MNFSVRPALCSQRIAAFGIHAARVDSYNGNIITVNDRQPRTEAVAIAGNRFLAVAMNEKVLSPASGKTKKMNLESRTVVPGFIDAHTHPAEAGLMHLRQVDCDLRSIAEIQKAILERDRILGAGIDTSFGDGWVRIGGMKMVADGSISEWTAWLSRP